MDALLTLNGGSSSLKFAVYPLPLAADDSALYRGLVDRIGLAPHMVVKDAEGRLQTEQVLPAGADNSLAVHYRLSLDAVFAWLAQHAARPVAIGHRVVHGGDRYAKPVKLDSPTIAFLETLNPLAPLHQPYNLLAIKEMASHHAEVPQVACFDTAFHRDQPPQAQAFALPRALTEQGIKRYGFHGLSYDYIARQLPAVLEPPQRAKVVVAHLGNGASMCALRDGRSIASTMGFTAVDGLVMGTRTGNIDPGVLLYLMERQGYDLPRLTKLLYKESGLLGVSGLSSDMRELVESVDPHAQEAVDLFCYRCVREIGSLAAALGGLDALVFTAGIGENAPQIRARIVGELGWLGAELDPQANAVGAAQISPPGGAVSVLVLPTNEESMIARYTAEVLGL